MYNNWTKTQDIEQTNWVIWEEQNKQEQNKLKQNKHEQIKQERREKKTQPKEN